jgi:hypothetical protein
MTDKPSRPTLDGMDDLWEADQEASLRRARDKAKSPTRSGTNPWDDRGLPLFDAAPGHLAPPGEGPPSSRKSPVRSGTLSIDELLPPAVKYRDEARARAQARAIYTASSPIRGGTRSWDDLLAELRNDPNAQLLRVSANDTVFGGSDKDPFEDLSTDLRDWLAPDAKGR